MKKFTSLLTAVLVVAAIGLAYAKDVRATDMSKVYDELLGARQEIPFESYSVHMNVLGASVIGTAAGGIRSGVLDGSKLFDELLGARQDIPFETYTGHAAAWEPDTMGTAAGGIRSDVADGSKIFNELLGARQPVPFE